MEDAAEYQETPYAFTKYVSYAVIAIGWLSVFAAAVMAIEIAENVPSYNRTLEMFLPSIGIASSGLVMALLGHIGVVVVDIANSKPIKP